MNSLPASFFFLSTIIQLNGRISHGGAFYVSDYFDAIAQLLRKPVALIILILAIF
jgi:hypothetical protein